MSADNYFVLVTDELPLPSRFFTFATATPASIAAAWDAALAAKAASDTPARWCVVGVWRPSILPRGPWGTAQPVGR